MNPVVMTTGPGVIMATATASTNCCSLSQWYSFTTPPYKKGTMAKPLPNTKAPAFVKNQAICQSLPPVPVVADICKSAGQVNIVSVFLSNVGGLFTNQISTPDPSINQMFSSSVIKVKAVSTINIPHNQKFLPMLLVVNL